MASQLCVQEVELLNLVKDHPNIVSLIDACLDEGSHRVWLILELCTGGTLLQRLFHAEMGEREAAVWFRAMVDMLFFCHQLGMQSHRTEKKAKKAVQC